MNQPILPSEAIEASPVVRPDPLQQFKASVLALLRQTGIAFVTAEYCGSGDDGQIDTICAFDAQNQPIVIDTPTAITIGNLEDKRVFTSLRALLADFAWSCVCTHHDGFWNDGGGDGNVFINAATSEVKIEHTDRFVSTEYTETEV